MDNTALDVELTKQGHDQVKIAEPTRESVESDNLYPSLQMSQEILGQTVIRFSCCIVGLTHRPISHMGVFEKCR